MVSLKYKIIELLAREYGELRTISDISKKLKCAYSHAHKFVRELEKEEVLIVKKVGNVAVCSINLKSPLALSYLSIIESRKMLAWKKKNPHADKIFEKIDRVKDGVHFVLVKNNKVIVVIPKGISGYDYTIFRNRVVLTSQEFLKKRRLYPNAVILHGAEKLWGSVDG